MDTITRLGFVIVTRFIREQRYSRIIVSMVPLGTPSRPPRHTSRQRNCHSDWGRHGNCACHTEDRDPSRGKRRDTLYLRAKRNICIWTRARAIESLAWDPDLARLVGAAGRRRVERQFRMPRHVERLEALLASARDTAPGAIGA